MFSVGQLICITLVKMLCKYLMSVGQLGANSIHVYVIVIRYLYWVEESSLQLYIYDIEMLTVAHQVDLADFISSHSGFSLASFTDSLYIAANSTVIRVNTERRPAQIVRVTDSQADITHIAGDDIQLQPKCEQITSHPYKAEIFLYKP